jgi:hypothetical protein
MVSLLGLSSRIIFPLLIFAVFPQVLEKNGGDNETRTCDLCRDSLAVFGFTMDMVPNLKPENYTRIIPLHRSTVLCLRPPILVRSPKKAGINGSTQLSTSLENTCFHGANRSA